MKRLKMKPPWLLLLLISTTWLLISLCDCQLPSETSWPPEVAVAASTSQQPEQELDDDQIAQAAMPEAVGSRPRPHFAHDQEQAQDSIVIASSYQDKVYLPCKILDLDEGQTVSWIRKRDSLVLTIDKLRLIDEQRFQLNPARDDWTLVLRNPSESDAGLYECQVSSVEPKLSRTLELRIVRAESSISNFSSLFVRPNDVVQLTCTISAPQPTSYVYWYKNAREVVQFDDNLRRHTAQNEPDEQEPLMMIGSVERVARQIGPAGSKGQLVRPKTTANNERRANKNTTTKVLKNVFSSNKKFAISSKRANENDDQENSNSDDKPTRRTLSLSLKLNSENNTNTNDFPVHVSSSTLIIKQAQLNDTANYTCLPSNAKASQISVVVIQNGLGSQPEKRSLQTDSASSNIKLPRVSTLLLIAITLLAIIQCYDILLYVQR